MIYIVTLWSIPISNLARSASSCREPELVTGIYICFTPVLFQVSPSPDQTNPQSGCLSDWLKHPSHLISVRFRLAYLPTYLTKGSGGWRREELGNPPGKGGRGGVRYTTRTPLNHLSVCALTFDIYIITY